MCPLQQYYNSNAGYCWLMEAMDTYVSPTEGSSTKSNSLPCLPSARERDG